MNRKINLPRINRIIVKCWCRRKVEIGDVNSIEWFRLNFKVYYLKSTHTVLLVSKMNGTLTKSDPTKIKITVKEKFINQFGIFIRVALFVLVNVQCTQGFD